jgi:hypothetical protein
MGEGEISSCIYLPAAGFLNYDLKELETFQAGHVTSWCGSLPSSLKSSIVIKQQVTINRTGHSWNRAKFLDMKEN